MADEQSAKMIEATLALLEHERNKFLDRQAQHADKRRALAFDAHAGDAEACENQATLPFGNSIVDAIDLSL